MRTLALILALVLFDTTQAAAQARTLQGRVLAGSQPVANQPVTLHRVTSTGGETLGVDTTDAQGRFSLRYEPAGEAIHFGATRYEDQLYIGETFRDAPATADYSIAVGPGATPIDMGPPSATAATPPTPPDETSRKAGLMIVAIVGLTALAIVGFALSRRTDPMRRLLIEVADLDNRHEQTPIADYDTQRAELLRRLRETA